MTSAARVLIADDRACARDRPQLPVDPIAGKALTNAIAPARCEAAVTTTGGALGQDLSSHAVGHGSAGTRERLGPCGRGFPGQPRWRLA